MKSLKKQKSVASTATPTAIRNQLLRRIREAKLPNDAKQFSLAELRETGLAGKYKQPPDLPDGHFKLLVLQAIQIKEIRRECDTLRLEIENEKEYYSLIRDGLRNEPDPIKQAVIRRRAEADEARVARERAEKKRANENAVNQFIEADVTSLFRAG